MSLQVVTNYYDGMWHAETKFIHQLFKEDGRVNLRFTNATHCVGYKLITGEYKYLYYRNPDFRDYIFNELLSKPVVTPVLMREPIISDEEANLLLVQIVKDKSSLSRDVVMEAVRRSKKHANQLFVFRKLKKMYTFTNLRILAMNSPNQAKFVEECANTLYVPRKILENSITPHQFFKWMTTA